MIGKTIKFNDLQYTVIGVAPASFIGTEPGLPDFWIPIMMSGNAHFGPTWLDQRDSGWLRLVARLKPDATLQSASSEIAVLASRFHAADTVQTARAATTIVAPAGMLNPDEQSDAIPFAILLLAAVTLVLLIACANVANLQLARGLSRQKEMGIRTSLGATRGRLIRQLFAESLVLAAAAGGLGLLLAWWGAGLMLAILQPPGENSLLLSLSPDWRVIAYALGISLLAAIVSGIVPALRVSRQDPLHAMKEDEAPLAFTPLPKRAHFSSSARSLSHFSFCLEPAFSHALSAKPAPSIRASTRLTSPSSLRNCALATMTRIAALNSTAISSNASAHFRGVQNVAFSRSVPLSTDFMQTAAMAEGKEPPPDQQPKLVNFNEVSADFFSTLGIPIPRGRAFTPAEVSQGAKVVVISASLAEMLWPGEDAIGKRLRSGRTSPTYEVVGVANDVRNVYLWSQKVPYLYRPPAVRTSKDEDIMDAKILVRTNSDPSALIASLPGSFARSRSHRPRQRANSVRKYRHLGLAFATRRRSFHRARFARIVISISRYSRSNFIRSLSAHSRNRNPHGPRRRFTLRRPSIRRANVAPRFHRHSRRSRARHSRFAPALQFSLRTQRARRLRFYRRNYFHAGRLAGRFLHPSPPRHARRSHDRAPLRIICTDFRFA